MPAALHFYLFSTLRRPRRQPRWWPRSFALSELFQDLTNVFGGIYQPSIFISTEMQSTRAPQECFGRYMIKISSHLYAEDLRPFWVFWEILPLPKHARDSKSLTFAGTRVFLQPPDLVGWNDWSGAIGQCQIWELAQNPSQSEIAKTLHCAPYTLPTNWIPHLSYITFTSFIFRK
jgi:hypothetical protein